MCFMSFLISCGGMLRFLSAYIDGSWIEPLMLVVIVIRTFQPFALRVWMSEFYLLTFSEVVAVGDLSWHYVDLMNCIVYGGEGLKGG